MELDNLDLAEELVFGTVLVVLVPRPRPRRVGIDKYITSIGSSR